MKLIKKTIIINNNSFNSNNNNNSFNSNSNNNSFNSNSNNNNNNSFISNNNNNSFNSNYSNNRFLIKASCKSHKCNKICSTILKYLRIIFQQLFYKITI
jgi:hypothetical protein